MTTTTDYDLPRRPLGGLAEDSLDELKSRRASTVTVDLDEPDAAEEFELPGADLSDEELAVPVVPMRNDEFRCSKCFLIHHRTQLARGQAGQEICRECE